MILALDLHDMANEVSVSLSHYLKCHDKPRPVTQAMFPADMGILHSI